MGKIISSFGGKITEKLEAEFALRALMEVPEQFKIIKVMHALAHHL